ncbi:hypothetical protein Dester_1448 [Desulfurobacterium thermolithotrophum DSM 11699]|uniref:Uncharacterized protein n=1 Tax=Desulfurobacterium thermolithotrophum (strain DSM 11699 / BSA) TaxID=868864 RepID=F0S1Z7_DESTD|nr:hypothetical protein [Desulfurobacterium thermolithotrophum]ADY74078.1 hypothetical protein Dester_1448 [Desulfurobacterium thermolithotrophum DSM 11699]
MSVLFIVFLLVFFQKVAFAGIFYPLSQLHPPKKKIERKIPLQKFPELHLEGIVGGKFSMAIINGKYLKLGDKIEGCTVNKIDVTNSSVVLKCRSFNIKLRIDLLKSKEVVEDKIK